MNIRQLSVTLDWGTHEQEVGELVHDGRMIHFKFYPQYLEEGHSLSPIKLPLTANIHTGDPRLFDGLYGLFNDSLPDGWGRLLLDRRLTALGKNPLAIHPLEHLAHVGKSGLGALAYAPSLNDPGHDEHQIQIGALAKEMAVVLEGTSSSMLDELYSLGGSSGGARPKIHVGYRPSDRRIIHGQGTLPEGFTHWIVKFPSSFDRPDAAHVEYAYHLMAKAAGIEMSGCRLFESESGKHYFGTKRFDRIGSRRLHMHSASGLMHDDFRHSQMDYGHLMDCGFQLTRHAKVYGEVLRRAAFNVFAHNRDDHSKNFAFLMDEDGHWQFSPAYDLTFSSSAHGMHSTFVAGESKAPREEHLLELAKIFGIKKPHFIIEEVRDAISRWPHFAQQAGVGNESMKAIGNVLGEMGEM